MYRGTVRVSILSVPVDQVRRADALAACRAFLSGQACHQVLTANPEFVLAAMRQPALRALAGRASLVVPDGVGLLWASRRYGTQLAERIPGVDLVEDVCRLAAETGQGVYLLGGRTSVAQAAARVLCGEVPGLRIAAFPREHRAGDSLPLFWEELARLRPAVLLVAYGMPRQELWIDTRRGRLQACGVRIAMGVGGSFDTIGGMVPRAPYWLRAAGLEWFWRFLMEPQRLPRVLRATIVFPIAVVCDAVGARRRMSVPQARTRVPS